MKGIGALPSFAMKIRRDRRQVFNAHSQYFFTKIGNTFAQESEMQNECNAYIFNGL
jgi:hypothetical protein